jgi:hypothetical protein
MKDVQAIEEPYSPQKRPSITSNYTFLPFIPYFFSWSFLPTRIRRIPHAYPNSHTANQTQCLYPCVSEPTKLPKTSKNEFEIMAIN